MIVKGKGGYFAASSAGRHLSKKPKGKKAALMQLYAMEINRTRSKKAASAEVKRAAQGM